MKLRTAVRAEDATAIRQWCEQRLSAWPEHRRRTVATSLGETHLTSTGPDDAPTVLWLPGTNFNAATSAALALAVGGRVRFVAADLPGQPGLSSLDPVGRDRMARYGAWVHEVVEALRAPRLTLAGHSLGAAIALAAVPTPIIDRLVLVSPAGLAGVAMSRSMLRASLPWLLRPTDERSARVARMMQYDSSAVDPAVVEWLTLAARSMRQVGAPGPLDRELLERWRDHPVRVLVGEADVFFPPDALRAPVQELLRGHVQVVAGAGHLLPEERPGIVADALVSAR